MDWEKAEARVEETELEPPRPSPLSTREWGFGITAVILVALCLLAEFLPFLHFFALMGSLPSMAITIGFAFATLVAAVRLEPRRAGMLLVVSLLSAGAFVQSARVVLGVPWWVTSRAAPAIEALVARYGEGPFPAGMNELPPEIRAALRSSNCFYSPWDDQPETFRLNCSVAMLHTATYDHRIRRWGNTPF